MNEFQQRWKEAMPRFFKRVCWVCSLISGTALAVNTELLRHGAELPEWWTQALPYLIGIPAGMAFMAKFTVDGGYSAELKQKEESRKQNIAKVESRKQSGDELKQENNEL